jgi:hypothetical protein
VKIVEMDDEELYVPDDVLEEANVARCQMLRKEQKQLEKSTKLCVNENH